MSVKGQLLTSLRMKVNYMGKTVIQEAEGGATKEYEGLAKGPCGWVCSFQAARNRFWLKMFVF